jgi:excisionase family DNA binding protein
MKATTADRRVDRATTVSQGDGVARRDTTDARPSVVLQPELYRIRDAAAVLAVSPRMIYAFIETGALRAVRLPSTGSKRPPVRIARADLLAFIDRQRGVPA